MSPDLDQPKTASLLQGWKPRNCPACGHEVRKSKYEDNVGFCDSDGSFDVAKIVFDKEKSTVTLYDSSTVEMVEHEATVEKPPTEET